MRAASAAGWDGGWFRYTGNIDHNALVVSAHAPSSRTAREPRRRYTCLLKELSFQVSFVGLLKRDERN